jgi:hypothetical protein
MNSFQIYYKKMITHKSVKDAAEIYNITKKYFLQSKANDLQLKSMPDSSRKAKYLACTDSSLLRLCPASAKK